MKNSIHSEAKFLYLYCIARADRIISMNGMGLDGRSPLSRICYQDLCAVLSAIRLEEVCKPSNDTPPCLKPPSHIMEGVRDPAWMGTRIWHHEKVVEQIMHHSPVLPAPFGTIFSSAEKIAQLLEVNYVLISRFLEHVKDKEEWAVKGLLNREKARTNLLATLRAGREEQLIFLPPGSRYVQELRIKARVEKELNRWLGGLCEGMLNDLCMHATDFTRRKVLHNINSIEDMDMIVNWAFLVPRHAAMEFQSRIQRSNADRSRLGLIFSCTGPWPPYSFCPSLEI